MLSRIEGFFLEAYARTDRHTARNARIVLYFLLVSALFALGYFLNSYATGFLAARYLMATTVAWYVLQLSSMRLGFGIKYQIQAYLFSSWTIVFVLSFASGGIVSYVLPWLVMIPIVALIFGNKTSISVWTIVSLATLAFYYFVDPRQHLGEKWIMRFDPILTVSLHGGLILIMLWITNIFRTEQEALLRQVEDQNHALQATEEELRQSIEELSATQDVLAEKEAESSSIVDALRTHYHITEFDLDGTITYANEPVVTMTGRDPIGLNRFNHMDDRQRPSRLEAWEKIKNGQSLSQESMYKVEGHEFWVMSTYAPIMGRLNNVSRIMSVAHDITESKHQAIALNDINNKLKEALDEIKSINENLEQRVRARTLDLEEKNRRLTEYAFINSHVLRAPLCRLMGLVQLLELSKMRDLEPDLLKYLKHSGDELDAVVKRINLAIESGGSFDRDSLIKR